VSYRLTYAMNHRTIMVWLIRAWRCCCPRSRKRWAISLARTQAVSRVCEGRRESCALRRWSSRKDLGGLKASVLDVPEALLLSGRTLPSDSL
jgi:hypothetical protein